MSRFDAILTSTPLDSTAAKVTARGEHWEPENQMPPGMQHWKSPPPMKSVVDPPDLTGTKFGKFTVIGLLDLPGGKNRGARWVCRCVCGDFEARTGQAISMRAAGLVGNKANDHLQIGYQCWYCAQWQVAQHRYKKHGARPLKNFTHASTKIIEARTPQTIIAEKLFNLGLRDGLENAAETLIGELNRHGYRVVRAAPSSTKGTT